MNGFIISVSSSRQGGSRFTSFCFGHLFDANRNCTLHLARANCHGSQTDSCRSGGTRGFYFEGFNPSQAYPIGNKCSDALLPAQYPRHHIADKNCGSRFSLRIQQGSEDGFSRQLAE